MQNLQVHSTLNAYLYQLNQPGLLKLSGSDQLAFVQRQTTNNINLLSQDKGIVSVLTTPLARILDVFFLFMDNNQEEPMLSLVTLPGRSQATIRFLKSRIFFKDQVGISDNSDLMCQFWLEGTNLDSVLAESGISSLPIVDGIIKTRLAGHDVILIGRRSLNGIGYLFLVPELAAKEARALLEQSGAKLLTDQEYETMRIESGSPGTKTELTDAYTPFEVGLGYAVDANKGCYTGQEILARQVTYDKITRQLTGLRMEVVADPGAQLMADGKPAGEITSATVSPKFGPIALAVVKRPFFEPGTTLQVKLGEHTIPATTCQLPFIQLDTPLT